MFALRHSNRQRNIWAVSLLDVQPADRVLEVGFGPGVAIAEFAGRATHGHVFGIDHSRAMVRHASRRNAVAVRAGRVHLTHASVERLRELRHLLRPAGRIALVSQPRCPGATRETTVQAAQELQDMLTHAGFTHLRVETLHLNPPVACVLATNPTNTTP